MREPGAQPHLHELVHLDFLDGVAAVQLALRLVHRLVGVQVDI